MSTTPATTSGRTFPLGTVRLGPGPFAVAQQRALEAVLDIDLDRLLAPFLAAAGLDGEAEPYGDWESGGLDGHIGGHVLSAHAKLWAVTGLDVLHDRMEHLLDVLERCQDAVGTGYVGGVPDGPALGEELAAGRIDADLFSLNGRWVPVYNLHKTLAGLIDAATHGRSERALTMATRWADWWLSVTKALTDEHVERILTAEFGGLNESFVELGTLAGREDLVAEGRRLSHRRLLDPLADGGDPLDGLHANTQIPKVLGYQRLADLAPDGDPEARFATAADAFWTSVVERRTLAIGGNSVREHFHPSSDFTEVMTDREGPETCNTHNMVELARLRLDRRHDVAAIDLAERALFNHLVSSVHPRRGGFVYFTPMRPVHYRVYSRPHLSMWCCVGSGLEGHTRYNELIYTHDGPDLRVELYAPSVLEWAEEGLRVQVSTALPYRDEALIRVTSAAPRARTVRLRVPSWAELVGLRVDGEPVEPVVVDGYVELTRTWSGTTSVAIRLEPRLVAEALPDGSGWVAFRYGPVVLASRGGAGKLAGLVAGPDRMAHVAHGRMVPMRQSPIVVAEPPESAVAPVDEPTLTFELAVLRERSGELVPGAVLLEPFAGIHDERYSIYFAADADPSRALDTLRSLDAAADAAATVFDKVAAGEQQPEVDHGFTGERTRAGGSGGIHWRSTTGWFEYRLRCPDGPAAVRARFVDRAASRRRILLNGLEVTAPTAPADREGFAEHEYDLTGAVREAGAPGEVVFRVEAVDGADSGDLLLVEVVLRED
ncbi:glycoside hydrolase family 127 protein [Antribacter sp. KLBMP9083]|uniref:Glycoside hydrolase family 127 protein n=1 Tax=Antribacter soli TaxID=2910976 RepID=A0AA41U731_9MICO|nr:beta-L-arabinofuranosidase domain-containing protein [Antribacter soli]MCF4120900.1 glycoside hydrolase family 127 protein [Antribacter soli]